MTIEQLIEHLKTLPPNYSLVGQYKDSNGTWVMTTVYEKHFFIVPQSNWMCCVQLIPEQVFED